MCYCKRDRKSVRVQGVVRLNVGLETRQEIGACAISSRMAFTSGIAGGVGVRQSTTPGRHFAIVDTCASSHSTLHSTKRMLSTDFYVGRHESVCVQVALLKALIASKTTAHYVSNLMEGLYASCNC
ncbi:hypothetical protein AVEN_152677-1 [Araneus ventricosus]|uniref:Uncharacterized protein n=1 Tax=Araneus ventricosus TaxID=182803 RepID=A0A4Y2HVY0_ARAVE|nr:hypothetical protein AVEN_152677-1 [Araneus ventricosus]